MIFFFRTALAVCMICAAFAQQASAQEGDLTGRILVATPELRDTNFERTVIYMIRHNKGGALGLVVNEPMGEVPLRKLLGAEGQDKIQAGQADASSPVTVHYGGPVEPRQAFILHSTEVMLTGSVKVGDKVAFSNQRETLESLTGLERPRHLVLTLGYAGWAPGQLESEIEQGSWYVAEWDEFLVFGKNHAAKWDRAIARYGPEL